jgi:hypothetical protein
MIPIMNPDPNPITKPDPTQYPIRVINPILGSEQDLDLYHDQNTHTDPDL